MVAWSGWTVDVIDKKNQLPDSSTAEEAYERIGVVKRVRDLSEALLNDLSTERAAELLALMEIMVEEEKVSHEHQRVYGDTI